MDIDGHEENFVFGILISWEDIALTLWKIKKENGGGGDSIFFWETLKAVSLSCLRNASFNRGRKEVNLQRGSRLFMYLYIFKPYTAFVANHHAFNHHKIFFLNRVVLNFKIPI